MIPPAGWRPPPVTQWGDLTTAQARRLARDLETALAHRDELLELDDPKRVIREARAIHAVLPRSRPADVHRRRTDLTEALDGRTT